MKNWVYAGAGLAISMAVVTAKPASADIKIEPRLSTGVSYYNLELDGQVLVGADSVDQVEFNDFLFFVGGGATISVDRFFIDLSGQYSFSGEDDVDLDVVSGGVEINNLAQSVEFDRIETAIAIGYRVTDQFAAYVGYRYADVDFDGASSVSGIGVDFSTDFEQKGPLIGASYAIPKTVLNGTLVANAAVTFLDGDLENELDAPAPLADIAFDIDGDAIGLNGGLSWTRPVGEGLRLVLGGDVSSYRFDDDDGDTDFDELIARIRAELRYSFDSSTLFGN